jgi:energy-coupling factor transport system ATP-binding protein
MSELVAEHVSFGFGERLLLHDINITVKAGEMIVCLGANASGKTTLLRLLSGLLTPGTGHIHVRGTSDSTPRNQVAILIQNPDHQMMAATVEEEIALGLELRGRDPKIIRASVDSLLARFQLEAFKHHPPQALSGGQKQRVALAAIMATMPQFLLLDEPDSFLDAPSRRELMGGVEEVRGDCGIVWTTPHPRRMPEVERYCLLSAGRLEECTREEILSISDAARALA